MPPLVCSVRSAVCVPAGAGVCGSGYAFVALLVSTPVYEFTYFMERKQKVLQKLRFDIEKDRKESCGDANQKSALGQAGRSHPEL